MLSVLPKWIKIIETIISTHSLFIKNIYQSVSNLTTILHHLPALFCSVHHLQSLLYVLFALKGMMQVQYLQLQRLIIHMTKILH